MDKDKKQRLAEKDDAWTCTKTVHLGPDIDWETVMEKYNDLNRDTALFAEVSNTELSTWDWILHRLRVTVGMNTAELWCDCHPSTYPEHEVTVHHRKVYRFFKALAYRLDTSLQEAIQLAVYHVDAVREALGVQAESMEVHVSDQDLSGGDSGGVSSPEELDEVRDAIQEKLDAKGESQ